jgi:hypothetical protein
MALTQISTQGIKDGTITGTDLATNVDLVDNQKLRLGTGNDLEIFHNATNSVIADVGNGNLSLQTNGTDINFWNSTDGEYIARFIRNGAVELYHDNSKKFETTSTGATVTGSLNLGSGDLLLTGNVDLEDSSGAGNNRIKLGASDDLQIYHDGTASFIQNITACTLLLQNEGNIQFEAKSGEDSCKMIPHGAVELYYDNSKKLETTSGGVDVDGSVTADDIITAGALLHEGDTDTLVHFSAANTIELKTGGVSRLAVTNAGLALQNGYFNSNGNRIILGDSSGANDDRLVFGNNNDLEVYHDGTNSYIQNLTGALRVYNHVLDVRNDAGNETILKGSANGSVELYHNNSKKFETKSTGGQITGQLQFADGGSSTGSNMVSFGSSDDLKIYHDGSTSHVQDNVSNVLRISSDSIALQSGDKSEAGLVYSKNGAVELYYDNSVRIRTQSYGNEYHNQQHKFIHSNSGGVGAYLSLFNTSTTAGSKTGIVFGIGNSNAILDGGDYGEGQIKCFTDSGLYGNLEFNLHVGANRSYMKIVGNGAGHTGAGAGTEGMRGGVAFGCAGIAIDRSWTGQPGIQVFNQNTEGDTDQGTFRFHGWNRSYASYPDSSGNDFSVNLVADGSGLSSDERRKTGIATITNALDTITKMRGVSFQFVNRELEPQTHMSMDNGKKLGFIAQEVIPLLPQLILDSGEKNVPLENGWCDRYSMDYSGMTAVLVEAIKELTAKVEALETEVAALKAA